MPKKRYTTEELYREMMKLLWKLDAQAADYFDAPIAHAMGIVLPSSSVSSEDEDSE